MKKMTESLSIIKTAVICQRGFQVRGFVPIGMLEYWKIGHGSNSGIQGFRNLGIEGILSILIY
jgi:hypothetical protein